MSETFDQAATPRGNRALRIAATTAITVLCLTTLSVIIAFVAHGKFSIPSSAMNPTLVVGDHLLASRMAWEGELERGDVAIFDLHHGKGEGTLNYIKRVIGLPGDRIALAGGQLIINGTPIERRRVEPRRSDNGTELVPAFEETLPSGRTYTVLEAQENGDFDTMAEITVPPRHYFVMGDNRDNSYDSRAMKKVGFVPREAFFGKAKFIHFSFAPPNGLRFDRIGWIR